MAKKKSHLAKDLVEVFGSVPWWVGVIAAVISYVALHLVAKPAVVQITAPGQLSAAITQSIFKSLATVGQYLVPVICLAGACMSWIRQKQRHRHAQRAGRQWSNVKPSAGPVLAMSSGGAQHTQAVGEFVRSRG